MGSATYIKEAELDNREEEIELISTEGICICIKREVAKQCECIDAMLRAHDCREASLRRVNFPTLSHRVLKKVVEYLHYKFQQSTSTDAPREFYIEDEILLELLIAADYLDV
ncbi:hypothetical protein IE077_000296 [Cardiosporidium cionae]|uniref:Elongin-C n=1 Tax=Cardiosporidium cionae TaxID=476202 RepID=A0ABQ7J4L9_9APIC|nr:hypothetical protein IE077_000296 [Cardiosporidium cionae]|eukprot:KAF8818373.1 hypothetical protein IE077_000296 [Cardiosporidium cionae]